MAIKPNFAFKPTICGEKVILRPFQLEDVQPMLTILSDYEVSKLTGSVCTDKEAYSTANLGGNGKNNTVV